MKRRAAPMTVTELLSLPPAVDLSTAARALSISRTTAYSMAKQDAFPVPLLRLGVQYRARRSDLLKLLGIAEAA